MKNSSGARIALLTLVVLLAGRYFASAETDLNAGLARAAELKQPLMVLVGESGQSRADDAALALLESAAVKDKTGQMVVVMLDVGVSRNRATAARFHIVETPLLLCLSSKGVIISRDEKPIAKSLVLKRIEEAKQQGTEVDAKLGALQEVAGRDKGNLTAQFELTDFLLARHNDLESIPWLEMIAHSKVNAPPARVRAWVALGRAHLWIAEAEKARHEAEDLMAELGTATPEAKAGGELVLGLQDAHLKRAALARKEFEEAIAAAPESDYGKQARAALTKLPEDGK